jgi:hypothetical protein
MTLLEPEKVLFGAAMGATPGIGSGSMYLVSVSGSSGVYFEYRNVRFRNSVWAECAATPRSAGR